MQTVLFQAPSPPYQPINLEQWQQGMAARIDAWYKDSPSREDISGVEKGRVKRFEVNYHNAIFYLYRPSPNIPTPTDSQLLVMTQAATNMIQLYRQAFREQKLHIYWQAVEYLCSSGTALMFAYAHSSQVRDMLTFRSLESLVHTCSSALWGMVERFPVFKGKRDAFDLTVSKTLADLGSTFDTSHECLPTSSATDKEGLRQLSGDSMAQSTGTQSLRGGLQQFPCGDVQFPLVENFSARNNTSQSGILLPSMAAIGQLDDQVHLDDISLTGHDDLSMLWEAVGGVNGNLNPTWI